MPDRKHGEIEKSFGALIDEGYIYRSITVGDAKAEELEKVSDKILAAAFKNRHDEPLMRSAIRLGELLHEIIRFKITPYGESLSHQIPYKIKKRLDVYR